MAFRLTSESIGGALFSPCRVWRYSLWREWDIGPRVAFIGLNPSTADEMKNDPTIRRCINYAKIWGYSGLWMINLFGLRSTDPKNLYYHEDPIGTTNNDVISDVAKRAEKVVLCWGNHGQHLSRGKNLVTLLVENGHSEKLYAFGYTKAGEPKHPLYLSGNLKLIRHEEKG